MSTEDIIDQEIIEQVDDVVDDPTLVDDPTDDPSEYKYDFGDKKFKTQDEAIAHAKALLAQKEQDNLILNAQHQAMRETYSQFQIPQNVTPPVQQTPQRDPEWEQKFYADPQAVLEAERQKITQQVLQTVHSQVTETQATEQVWGMFSKSHPDLVNFRKDVEIMYAENKKLIDTVAATGGPEAALKILADKTREKFRAYMEATKPRKTLTNDKKQAPAGGQNNVTPPPPKEKAMSFTEQMSTLNAKRRGLA